MGTVEAEGAGLYFQKAGAAAYTSELLGEYQLLSALDDGLDHAVTFSDRRFNRLGYAAHLSVFADDQPVHDNLDVMPLLLIQVQVVQFIQHVDGAVDPYSHEAGLASGFENLFVFPFFAPHLGR